jgi:hypothetical protein
MVDNYRLYNIKMNKNTGSYVHLPKQLEINAKITPSGMVILVNGEEFPITYPQEVWKTYPKQDRDILLDNIAYSSTIFLPQMLELHSIFYHTSRPVAETFLYKNGIYDMPICAIVDGKPSMDYVKRFFNTQYLFADNQIKVPPKVDFNPKLPKKRSAIVPFSFGKESMLSFALCKELGIEPILVNFIEPANEFEYMHKKRLMEEFEKKAKVKVYTVHYEPGMLRYGKRWGLETELGWGLQTTEYALLCLPFAEHFKADYIVLGNEQSCNDIFYNKEDILTFKAGYDQHGDWATQQGLLSSILAGKKIQVISFMEPVYEIAITRILHNRYPEYGKYQMSCMADNDNAANNRWCQHCVKCGYMYALCCAAGLDLARVGFTENLFDEKHEKIYDHFFNYDSKAPEYGSQEELGLAFYIASKKGFKGASIDRFNKELFARFDKSKKELISQYLGMHSHGNIPGDLKDDVLGIYKEELGNFISTL